MDRKSYKLVRADIKSGDLLAWEGRSIFSLAIRLWTRSTVTHVGIAWVHQGRVFVLEAKEHKGVRMSALSRAGDFMHIPTNSKWDDRVEAVAFEPMGLPYSWGDIVAVIFKRKLKAPGYICSEYVHMVLSELSFDLMYTSPTPGDMVEGVLQQTKGKPVRVSNPIARLIPDKIRKAVTR